MVEFVETRRIEPNHHAIFIFSMGLIAIIRGCMLWGLKTPAICLYFAGTIEEDDDALVHHWTIQKNARLFLCLQHRD